MKGTHQVAEGNAAAKQAVFPVFLVAQMGPIAMIMKNAQLHCLNRHGLNPERPMHN